MALTFEEAVTAFEKLHGPIADVAVMNAPPPPERYRVVTTDGLALITAGSAERPAIVRHWKAIYALLLRDDATQLEALSGATANGLPLECRPDVVRELHAIGDVQLPPRGEPVAWRPGAGE